MVHFHNQTGEAYSATLSLNWHLCAINLPPLTIILLHIFA